MDLITIEINKIVADFQGLRIYLNSDPWGRVKFALYNISFIYMAISFARTRFYYFGRSWEYGKFEIEYFVRFLFVISSAIAMLHNTYAKSWILKLALIIPLILLMNRFKDKS